MWTPANRPTYDRSRLRYPSDLTDEEWALIAPLVPAAKPGGNMRTIDEREVGIHPVTAAYRGDAEPAFYFHGRSLERR